MKPPPPMLPASGQVTARAKPTATAASTALPPFFRMAAPTSEAGADTETTMPLRPSALWAAWALLANRAGQPASAARKHDRCRREVVIHQPSCRRLWVVRHLAVELRWAVEPCG